MRRYLKTRRLRVLSKQSQLLACADRWPEQIAPQRHAASPKPKSCRRRLEPAPDHPRIGARPGHPRAKPRIIKLALARRTQQREHVLELARIMRAQPFGKEFADFKRQPPQDITTVARAHGLRAGEDRLDL